MDFNLFNQNPDIELERKAYETGFKNSEKNNSLIFINNFLFNYFSHRDHYMRTQDLPWIQENSATFGMLHDKIDREYDLKPDKNFSPLFLGTKILDFYAQIDELSKRYGVQVWLNSYEGYPSAGVLEKENKEVLDNVIKIYFEMRERGFWRYKDLIA